MSAGYYLISKATDRFYALTSGATAAHAEGCRCHLAKHITAALTRHGLPTDIAARAHAAPDTVCMEAHRMGVTAIEIAAACALAERDYLATLEGKS